MASTNTHLVSVVIQSSGLREMNQGLGQLEKGASKTKFAMSALIGTAIKTIPVWFALRTAYIQTFKTFSEGIDYIVEADKGLAKAMAVSTNSTAAFREELQRVGRTTMIETGKNATDVYEAFYQIGTSGKDAEVALQGMGSILKTSVALMGEVTPTGRAMVDIYNRFGDSIKGATTPLEKFEQIGATITLLWTKNNFLLSEFTDSLKTFGATANIANLTFDETAALIATVNDQMLRGTRGGTSLSRTFTFMVQNIKSVNDLLKKQGYITRDLNIDQSDLLGLWESTALAIRDMGENEAAALASVQKIFGARAKDSIAIIAKSWEDYAANVKLLKDNYGELRIEELNRQFKIQSQTVSIQLGIFTNLRNIMFETFVNGLTGTTNYAAGLEKINESMKGIITSGYVMGLTMSAFFNTFFPIAKLKYDLKELNVIMENLFSRDLGKKLEDFKKNNQKPTSIVDILPNNLTKKINELNESIFSKSGELAKRNAAALQKRIEENAAGLGSSGELYGQEYGKSFKEGFQSELKGLLLGENQDFFGSIEILLRDHVASAMSAGISNGIGNAFGSLGGIFKDIEGMFESPSNKMYTAISDGSIFGAKEIEKAITEGSTAGGDIIAEKIEGTLLPFKEFSVKVGKVAEFSDFTGLPIGAEVASGYNTGMGKRQTGGIVPIGAFVGEGYNVGIASKAETSEKAAAAGFWRKLGDGFGSIGTGLGGNKQALAIALSSYSLSRGIGGQGMLGGIGSGLSSLAMTSSLKGVMGAAGSFGQLKNIISGTSGGGLFGTQGLGIGGTLGYLGQAGKLNGLQGGLGILGGLTSAYSGYKAGDTMGMIGGGLTAMGSGLAMTGIGTIPGIALMAVGTIMSMFSKKSKTTVQTQEETFKVSSKIDITNKRLEMINRDLSSIRQSVETYILPQSAYFATNSVSEQFNIDSKRLLT